MERIMHLLKLIIFLSFCTYFVLGQVETGLESNDVVVRDPSESYENYRRRLATSLLPISQLLPLSSTVEVYYDPPNGTASPSALGIYAWSNQKTAKIYYNILGENPTLNSSYADAKSPYITVTTPFKGTRDRNVKLIAVYEDDKGNTFRSDLVNITYFVESRARPYSYAYLVPGIESGGYFIQIMLEESAAARPQSSTTQEFSDFFSNLGVGTYSSQVSPLKLTDLDSDLQGFEGGFPYNVSGKYYGLLIPFHNGKKFFGKVVRVDLKDGMSNVTTCAGSYVYEFYNSTSGEIEHSGTKSPTDTDVCVYILDVGSLHPEAVGFRRGFLSYPYGFLSPGQYGVAVRLDLVHFSLNRTRIVDLSSINREYGGYSGGFGDGNWACFNPYRSFVGRVGGIRSDLPVDANNLTPYYNSIMVCINETLWNMPSSASNTSKMAALRTMDFSIIRPDFRGFSDALRVGRYAYICPLNYADTSYSPYLLRINLGLEDIGAAIDVAAVTYGGIRSMVTTLNLSMVDTSLKGFSGLFSAGQYLFLVPFRNAYEPQNGQRGHGNAVRLDMNSFGPSGVKFMDVSSTTRNQIPSFADNQLRGFSYGFASGLYAIFVPFFNAAFHGRIARFQLLSSDLTADLQELVLTSDRKKANVYKGYRGGFVSIWQGVDA